MYANSTAYLTDSRFHKPSKLSRKNTLALCYSDSSFPPQTSLLDSKHLEMGRTDTSSWANVMESFHKIYESDTWTRTHTRTIHGYPSQTNMDLDPI